MLRNYLKIALRSFWKHKYNSALNILGLTIGLTGCLLIGFFVWDEWKFDRFVPESDRIYRVYDERTGSDGKTGFFAVVPPTFAGAMQREFPEVDTALRLMNVYSDLLFEYEEQRYLEGKGLFAEPAFFSFFGLPLIEGDPQQALSEPNTVVLTESFAKKYFGDESPLGKTLTIDGDPATVTGVTADAPTYFHLDYKYLLSFAIIEEAVPEERMNSWVWQQFFTYLKLNERADSRQLEAKLPAFAERYAWPQTRSRGFTYVPYIQPLTAIHLTSSGFAWDIARRGNATHVWALLAIGLFLLLIAAINFINLATAQAEGRAQEVGIRKVSGAERPQLITQFIGEAVLMSIVAMLLATQISRLLLPYVNDFAGKNIPFYPEREPLIWLALIVLGLLVGLLAGAYPAFILSSFPLVAVLKGDPLRAGRSGQWMRKVLVVLQFSLTVLLLISALVVYQQVHFMAHKDLGFKPEQLLSFPLRGNLDERYDMVKETFLQHPGVLSASAAYGIPGDIVAGDDIIVPGREQSNPANMFLVDYDYIQTVGLEMVAGRPFSRTLATDSSSAFIINETAVKELGFGTPEEALGQRLHWDVWDRDSLKKGRVIGVVRDFHFTSLHNKVGTGVLHIHPESFWKVILRIRGGHTEETLTFVKQTWDSFGTGYPLEYQFVDESFEKMNRSEARLSTLMMVFTGLTILVACLGLLGLATYAAERRTKEIGIRKVLGASVQSIFRLLAQDFLKLVLIAILIGAPLAWYLMSHWLEGFPYQVEVSPWVFVVAGGAAVFIALITVSFQSMRAALTNPVESLRSE